MTANVTRGVIGTALALALGGCTAECVDKFDCRDHQIVNDDGTVTLFTCVDHNCIAGNSGGFVTAARPDGGTP